MNDVKGKWKNRALHYDVIVRETTADHVIYGGSDNADPRVLTREDFLANFRPVTPTFEIGDVVTVWDRNHPVTVVATNGPMVTVDGGRWRMAYGISALTPTGDKLPVLDESQWYIVHRDGWLAVGVSDRPYAEQRLAAHPEFYIAIATVRQGQFVSPRTDADGVEHLLPLASEDRTAP